MAAVYRAIVKRGYTPLVGSDDQVFPDNLGALKKGLQALLAEDANDDQRAGQKWAEAKGLLAEQSEAETGAGAQGAVAVIDEFAMYELGEGL